MADSTWRSRLYPLTVWLGVLVTAGLGLSARSAWPEPTWLATWLLPVLSVGWPAVHLATQGQLSDLGLQRPAWRGVAVVVAGSLLMPVGFMLVGVAPHLPPGLELARGTAIAALAEETLLRGYAFRQLHLRGRWSVRTALWSTAIVFGLLHIPMALSAGEGANLVGTVAITAAGGAWYAWLFSRWQWSLWVPIAAHFAMNLWWALFGAGATAGAGGAAAQSGRVAAIVIITAATLRMTKRTAPLTNA